MQLLAKTFEGLEPVLAQEIQQLGGKNIQILRRAVRYEGGKKLLYRSNLELRTALRILLPMHQFRIRDIDDMYRKTLRIEWSKYFSIEDTFAIDAVTSGEIVTHSKYAALKLKDAIADHFRRKFRQRPSVDKDDPTLRINLHIHKNTCTISFDSSGSSLHLRGYRTGTVPAPMNEVLAAGLVLASNWQCDTVLLDPMCGSGTILTEAAMIAYNIAPNRLRKFALRKWKNFDKKLWETILEEADDNIKEFDHLIIGSDKDFKAMKAARENIFSAHLEGKVEIMRTPFEKLEVPAPTGTIITNPPYDERLEEEDIEALYSSIGDLLKQHYTGWNAWLISSNKDAIKKIGLRPSKKMTLFNGPLECKFLGFEMYQGSKKDKEV